MSRIAMGEPNRFWNGRNVLVTGAYGFLGRWMVKELRAHGAFVVGLMRDQPGEARPALLPESQADYIVRGQLEDYECLLRALNEYEIETVLHLAAQPIVGVAYRNPRSTFEANIRGTWNLLEACREIVSVKRIVVASSDKAYGNAVRLPYDESMPLLGRHPYDVSKSCADLIAQSYYLTYGLPVSITRAANFYGGGDLNFNRIIPGTIRSVLNGTRPVLRSDGTMIRDYIYVRDVVAAYLLLAEAMDDKKFWGQAYNVSLEMQLSVLEVTTKILEVMGRADLQPIILNEANAEIPVQYLSAARARRELGWTPRFSLLEGLTETVDWYRNHFANNSASVTN
jgi:CDP-glucose 4,6-dehydratase